jgi:lipopolysaccharide exporter
LAGTTLSDASSLTSRSINALIWAYAGAITRVLAQLVIQVALARLLGPLAFGQAAMVFVVLSFGWLLAEGGFGSALIQKAELSDHDISYSLCWVLILSSAMGLAIFASAPLLAQALNDPEYMPLMRACGVLIPLQAVSNIPMSLLRRNLDMKRQQVLNVGGYLFGMGVVGMAMAVAGYGAWSLIIGFGVQTVLNLVVGYGFVKFPLKLRLSGDRQLRNFGLSVMATNMANWAIDNIDRMVVGKLWGTGSLGEYSAAGNLSRAPASILVGAAQSVVFSSASRVQDDNARVAKGFNAAACMVLLITCPVFCFLAMHASAVMDLLYGARWLNAAPLFAALCLSIPSYAMLSVAGPTLWGVGAARKEFTVQLLIVTLLVAGLFLLADHPLVYVVWLVPALYAFRSMLVVRALIRMIGLPAARAWHACLGGGVLSALVVVTSWAVAYLHMSLLSQALIAAALGSLACLVALRLMSNWILVPDLRQILLARASSSALARRLCGILGLRQPAA